MIDHVSHDGHCDYMYDDLSRTQKGASQRARFATSRSTPELLSFRMRIGNAWGPFKG